MTDAKRAGGLALAAILALAMGFLLATAYMSYRLNGHLERIDFLLLPLHAGTIREHLPQDFLACLALFLAPSLLALLGSTAVRNEALTTFGKTRWQTPSELKHAGFREASGYGFLLGKLGPPKSRAGFLSSTAFPHVYLTAPTGAGKGVGFVIPNLLTFKGSVVCLDVKGENFVLTSRHRRKLGDKVIRFAPGDFSDKGSHRYNPLARIAKLTDPDEQMMELRQVASLFLDAGNSNAESLLQGGIDIFVACGMLALQNGTPTLGAIHDLATGGSNKNKHYSDLASDVKHRATSLMFTNLGSINDKTLTSYLSLLMTSGLNAWSNPATQRLTAVSDFSFADLRRVPHAIYFDVGLGRLAMFAPLIRLFFADLVATLQEHEPGDDEPCPVLILLDEFEQLGRMPTIAQAIKTLRSYRGHLAIISQSIPGVDAIYGEDVRLSLQAGSGLQLYYAPADRKTAEEISHALGRTTKRVVAKTSPLGMARLKERGRLERSEEAALMTEDEVRVLPRDQVLIIPTGLNPIRAHRMTYYEDRQLKAILQAQTGVLPYPLKEVRQDAPAADPPNAPPEEARKALAPPRTGLPSPPRALAAPLKALPAPPKSLPAPPDPSAEPDGPPQANGDAAPEIAPHPSDPPQRPRRAGPVPPVEPRASLILPAQADTIRSALPQVSGVLADGARPRRRPPQRRARLSRARRASFAPPSLSILTAEEERAVRSASNRLLTVSAMLAADLPEPTEGDEELDGAPNEGPGGDPSP